jgi:adenylyltransferase/sulfurtransferase
MDAPEVDCTRAARMRAAGAAWIDVREPEEWADWHIDGTELLPLQQAAATVLQRFPDRDQQIIVSCATGARSGHLVAAMRDAGYTDVHNLRGGIKAWVAEGRPVLQGD